MERYKKLVLLHSNDMHGDLLAEDVGGRLVGGVSLLSGYVQKTRGENENTLYCIAGDMLQGSLIDLEFKGLSTIDVMNLLRPDVASLGNHETDYGLSHLLFLERCARFPILNANLFIKHPLTRIFKPCEIFETGGMKIMFIGIITREILAGIRADNLLSNLVDVEDAAAEVGRICNAYRKTDIDLTVLLTHIGFEEDKKLAALLDPEWGVDVIIGGHSHTVLERPEEVNGILIAQAGVGTDQIGRFDMTVDTDTNTVAEYEWSLVPIDGEHCPDDPAIERIIERYKTQTDDKYSRILCRFPRKLTHPARNRETELGGLFADALKEMLGVDIVLFGSGSIRQEYAEPVLSQGDLMALMPFDDKIYQLKLSGKQLKKILLHVFREEAFTGGHTEFFQISRGARVVYRRSGREIGEFAIGGEPVSDDAVYRTSVTGYHLKNCAASFGLPMEELRANGKETTLSTSVYDVLTEYFTDHPNPAEPETGRIVIGC
jgi:5'-nucleotidase